MLSPDDVIELLGLQPHPLEGGFFRETYRAADHVPGQERSLSTAIYFLITPTNFSLLHRLPTDELYHFYLGDPVEQLQLCPDGTGRVVTLGSDLKAGQVPQMLVPAGVWQGSRLVDGGRFALLGTTMAPGFAYPDYEPGDRKALTTRWTGFAAMVEKLTVER
jgi:predicted cupin superfamily sugar epimerase